MKHSRAHALIIVALASLAGGAAPAIVRADGPATDAQADSSVPVSPEAARRKKAELAKQPEPVKPDERTQLGSSVPVSQPLWLDRPEPGKRAFVPNVAYQGDRRGELTLRLVSDSMDASRARHFGEHSQGGGVGLNALNCIFDGGFPVCVELDGSLGRIGRKADGESVLVGKGSAKLQSDWFHLGLSYEKDLRFDKVFQADLGVVLASAKAATSVRASAGLGTFQAFDSRLIEAGPIAKVELESYLGPYLKLVARGEAGKYTHDAKRLRAMVGLRLTTDQKKTGENRGWTFFVEPGVIYEKSGYKAVPYPLNADESPSVERSSLTGIVAAGAAVP